MPPPNMAFTLDRDYGTEPLERSQSYDFKHAYVGADGGVCPKLNYTKELYEKSRGNATHPIFGNIHLSLQFMEQSLQKTEKAYKRRVLLYAFPFKL